jgi:hypothetical protein
MSRMLLGGEEKGVLPKPRPRPPTALIQIGVSVLEEALPECQVMYSVVNGPIAFETSLVLASALVRLPSPHLPFRPYIRHANEQQASGPSATTLDETGGEEKGVLPKPRPRPPTALIQIGVSVLEEALPALNPS